MRGFSLLLVTMGLALPGLSQSEGSSPIVSSGFNDFGFEFLTDNYSPDSNFVFSPFSMGVAFSMLVPAAKGTTLDQIKRTFRMPERDTLLLTYFNDIYQKDDTVGYRNANGIWHDRGEQLYPSYVESMKVFDAPLFEVDFSREEEASMEINSWFEQETEGKIKELITPDDLENVSVVLGNALYMKSNWEQPFDIALTGDATFTTADGQGLQTSFMNRNNFRSSYFEDLSVRMLALPFEGNRLSLVLVLPQRQTQKTMHDVLEVFSNGGFNEMVNQLQHRDISRLAVPKFSTEMKIKPKASLQRLGLRLAFHQGADFSGMAPRGLFIKKVLQKTFFQIDEEGVEAAAGTAILMKRSIPPQFICNEPFLYAVYDHALDVIVILGIFNKP